MLIEKTSALKVMVYFMAIDGKISDEEKIRVDEIGVELLGDDYAVKKEAISEECLNVINGIDFEDEAYDVIQEVIDKELANKIEKDGMGARLLIWDMFAVAYSDNEYSDNENRIINHIARLLEIDKSVLTEMKQLIATITKVNQEHDLLENSMEPYKIVRPMVIELENRLDILMQAAKELILDEDVYQYEKSEERKEGNDILAKTSKTIGDVTADVGKVAMDGLGFVGEQASKGLASLWGGASKLFGKKDNIPSENKEAEKVKEE